MNDRWDETWHRLREWTNGQAPSERLAAQVLLSEGYKNLDPSHPLGGPDGGKDAISKNGAMTWVMAVYFPRGQQPFAAIRKKFRADLQGVASNNAGGLVFVTNQELTLAERDELVAAAGQTAVELYHLERTAGVLDTPSMAQVRKQFLGIDESGAEMIPTFEGEIGHFGKAAKFEDFIFSNIRRIVQLDVYTA